MKHYQINIKSKSKKYLENFLTFCSKNLKNYNLINKPLKKNKKRKIVTILKSPHVNKKAQEQFQSDNYSKNINLYLTQNSIALLFLKKVSSTLFSNVIIRIKFSINSNLIKKTQTKILNPNNFKLNFLNQKSYSNEITRESTKNVLSRLKQEKIKNVLLQLKQEKIKNVLSRITKQKNTKNALLSQLKKENAKKVLLQLKKENAKNVLSKLQREKTITSLSKLRNIKLKKVSRLLKLLDIYGELVTKNNLLFKTKFR